jgi:hypothetical protein
MLALRAPVATATPGLRPAASVRGTVAAPAARPAARAAPLRARLATRRAASPLVASPHARVSTVATRRGARLVPTAAGDGEGASSSSSSSSATTASSEDDVDALAARLETLKAKSRDMLAEAESLERAAADDESSGTVIRKGLVPNRAEGADQGADQGADPVPDAPAKAVNFVATTVTVASLIAVGGAYAAGATSLLASEPILALFGSTAAFAAIKLIDLITPIVAEQQERAQEKAAAEAANAPKPKPKKMTSPEPEQDATTTTAAAKPEMPKAVNKPVEAAAATAAKVAMEAAKAAEATTAETKTAAAEEATEPAAAPAPSAAAAPAAAEESDVDAVAAAPISPAAAAALSNMDEPIPFTNLNEALVKADTAGVFASPSRSFVGAKAGLPSGRNGVAGAPGAVEDPDEVKLAAMRKVAAQRMAQRKAYEALAAEREAKSVDTAKVASENPLVFLVKFVLKVLLSPVIFLRWLIGLFAGGGRASEAK